MLQLCYLRTRCAEQRELGDRKELSETCTRESTISKRVRFLRRDIVKIENDPVFKAANVIYIYLVNDSMRLLEDMLFRAVDERGVRLITFYFDSPKRKPTASGFFGLLRLYTREGSLAD